MEKSTTVNSPDAPAAVGPYSQGRWAGELLFLSGQLGLDPATGQLVGETTAEQARQAMQNLEAVLKAAGLNWQNLVKTNIYLIDMSDFQSVNQIYGGYLAGVDDLPARACIQVAALPLGGRVEIEGVARR